MSLTSEIRALRKAGRHAEAVEQLTVAARQGLPPLELEAVGRLLSGMVEKGEVEPPALKIRLLGQVTTGWVLPMLTAISYGRRQPAVVTEGGYDQVMQDLLTLAPGDADVVVLMPWTQRLLGDGELSPAERVAVELDFWSQAQARVLASGAKLVMVGVDVTGAGPFGVQLGGGPSGPLGLVRALNAGLRERLPAGAAFVDLEATAGELGRRRFYDARRWFWTRQPFSEEGAAALAYALSAAVRALQTGPKKVLVLDLDNTLWGGVVGETGALGVQLGETPDGEAFRAFQRHCHALSKRGVVLAVASKNEPDDARAPFEQNPAMVLRLADLAAFEANWGPKSESIRRIAAELNLGLDSFVFFDDNPAERELVRQALPEVEVVDVPEDPAGYVSALEAGLWFEAVSLTAEDAERSRQYQAERQRKDLAATVDNLEDYLRSLQMVADVRTVDDADLSRVVQLLAKTNQWNLTTRRHAADVVRRFVDDPRGIALTVRLNDRFGDHGLVAVVLAEAAADDPETLRVDTWLMSCRVIARTAEEFLFGELIRRARALGYRRILGEYLPTKKNRQVAEIYPRFGLSELEAGAPDARLFVAELEVLTPPTTFVAGGSAGSAE